MKRRRGYNADVPLLLFARAPSQELFVQKNRLVGSIGKAPSSVTGSHIFLVAVAQSTKKSALSWSD